jgi:5-methyltetrahydrofolate--homocysteine methyltransferase
MAMRCGLTSAVMDVRSSQIVEAVKASDLMLGNDEWGSVWIARYRAAQKELAQKAAQVS